MVGLLRGFVLAATVPHQDTGDVSLRGARSSQQTPMDWHASSLTDLAGLGQRSSEADGSPLRPGRTATFDGADAISNERAGSWPETRRQAAMTTKSPVVARLVGFFVSPISSPVPRPGSPPPPAQASGPGAQASKVPWRMQHAWIPPLDDRRPPVRERHLVEHVALRIVFDEHHPIVPRLVDPAEGDAEVGRARNAPRVAYALTCDDDQLPQQRQNG